MATERYVPLDLFVITRKPDFTCLGNPGQALTEKLHGCLNLICTCFCSLLHFAVTCF